MNNITLQQFTTLFPEFSGVAPATLEAWIPIASMRVPVSVWGASTQYATALLLAHMLTAQGKSGLGSGGGPVTNEAVGDLSRGYGSVGDPASGDSVFMTTRYGIDYIALRRETVIGVTVTGNPIPFVGPIY